MKFWSLSVAMLCLIFRTSLSFDPERHRNWNKLDHENCGTKAVRNRIIGGEKAALGEFPWIVGLYNVIEKNNGSKYGYFFCGGSLVTSKHVVTAAHCLEVEKDKEKYVKAGENNMRTNPDCNQSTCAPPYQMRRVVNRTPHRRYDENTMMNDIAILKVDKPFNLNAYVNPICLPPKSLIDYEFQYDDAVVAGWGKTEKGIASEVLLKVKVSITDNTVCYIFWEDMYDDIAIDSERQICAGRDGQDSCNGDSGGPLMMKKYPDSGPEKTYLIGIVSFGSKRCGDGMPGVYTRVSYYEKWILDNLRF